VDKMRHDDRVKKIKELKKLPSISNKRLNYKSSRSKDFPVYEIPIDSIIFNSKNGRIGSFRIGFEKQYSPEKLDAENPEHEKKIMGSIWESDPSRNNKTLKDIQTHGQTEPGVITADGIIIDGNRRAVCLKKLASQASGNNYFLAAVLPDEMANAESEIRKLETELQMGRDQILDYDTTAKYIRAKEFKELDKLSDEVIAERFGEMTTSGKPDVKKIQTWHKILTQMEKFQKNQGYSGFYDNLADQKMEGHFVDLTGYVEKQSPDKSPVARNWKPTKSYISDLEEAYEDFARARIPVAEVRHLANPADGKSSGFFNYKSLWESFYQDYEKIIDGYEEKSFPQILKEDKGENTARDLMAARDKDFQDAITDKFAELLGDYKEKRDNIIKKDAPVKLLHKALDSLEQIDKKNAVYENKNNAQLAFDRIRSIVDTLEKNMHKDIE